MITKVIDDSTISFLVEEPDDLLTLRRIIKKQDVIVSDTTRVIKQDEDYSRPDRGERIKIRISLDVEKIALDAVFDKLQMKKIGDFLFAEAKTQLRRHCDDAFFRDGNCLPNASEFRR